MGEWNVDKIEREMALPLYFEWVAFNRIDPFTSWRDDLRFAMLSSNLVTTFVRIFTKSKRRYKPKDFMPRFLEKRRKKTPREMYQMLRTAFVAVGAKIIKKEKVSDDA